MSEQNGSTRGHVMRVPRSRGSVSGLLLILLGVWGALIPFVGPYFGFAFTPDTAWTWTVGRFWLEVLPGLAAIVGGFLLLTTANRAVAVFGGWLASVGGAWFVVGPVLGLLWAGPEGAVGVPVGTGVRAVMEQISFFSGLGVVILFLAAQALGRFTVRGVRDVRAVERRAERDRAAREDRADRDGTDLTDGTVRDGTVRDGAHEARPTGPVDTVETPQNADTSHGLRR